jgi:hypothetical protein
LLDKVHARIVTVTRTRQEIVGEFVVNWELEIRAGYTPADELLDDLSERFSGCTYTDEELDPDTDTELRRELIDHTNRFVEDQRREELTWDAVTVNDSIKAAFDDLRQQDLVVWEKAGLTIQDGWAVAAETRRSGDRGAVFFHQQDVYDALAGHSLLLAFGLFAEGDDATSELGEDVVAALRARGVATRWNSNPTRRIELEPFSWRKRRWTEAPRFPRLADARPRGGWWAKLTGRGRSPISPSLGDHAPLSPDPLTQLSLAEQFVWKRAALRTDQGFDSLLAESVRGAWHAAGGERGQAAHRGRPHMFLRAGEIACFVARDAFDNVCVEAEEIRRYADAARSG